MRSDYQHCLRGTLCICREPVRDRIRHVSQARCGYRNRYRRHGGAVGGILIAKLAGGLFDHYKALGDITVGYGIMFIICATAYIISWGVMQWLAPNFRRVEKL